MPIKCNNCPEFLQLTQPRCKKCGALNEIGY